MNTQINTDTASLIELKAAVYDQMVVVEQAQNNIKILNAEIAKRNQAGPPAEPEPNPESKEQ